MSCAPPSWRQPLLLTTPRVAFNQALFNVCFTTSLRGSLYMTLRPMSVSHWNCTSVTDGLKQSFADYTGSARPLNSTHKR